MVNWDTVTKPKIYGGIGVQDARLTNLALLGKLAWSMLHEGKKLWVQILSHKYIKNGSIWGENKCSSRSLIWRGIQKAAQALRGGFSFRIGSGNSSLWYTD